MLCSVNLNVKAIDKSGLPAHFLKPNELDRIVALVGSVGAKSMLEIGCHQGRTAAACLRNIYTLQEYTGVEVDRDYKPSLKSQQREIPERPGHLALSDKRFRLLLSPRGSLDLTPSMIGPVDVTFIDGDHGFEAVKHDSALARAVTLHLIIWHDYSNPEVEVTKRLRLDSEQGHKIYCVEDTWLAFERAPFA